MTKLLKLLTLGVLACVAFVASAPAQQYERYAYTTVLSGGTNNVALNSTNTYNTGAITTTLQEYLPIQIKYKFHEAPVGATPSVTVRLQRSLDNSNWESSGPLHVLLANGATNTCTWVTNINCAGIPYWRISTIENTNSAVITNVTVLYGTKR